MLIESWHKKKSKKNKFIFKLTRFVQLIRMQLFLRYVKKRKHDRNDLITLWLENKENTFLWHNETTYNHNVLSGLSSWASLGFVIGFWLCIMDKLGRSGGSADGTINMISSVVVVACKQIIIKLMNRTNEINTT